ILSPVLRRPLQFAGDQQPGHQQGSLHDRCPLRQGGHPMNLNARQQQLAALGILVLVLVLAFGLVINPLLRLFWQQGTTLTQLEDQLGRYQRLSAELEQTEQALQQLRAETPDTGLYLPERRPALASAWLQQHLNRLAGRGGCQMTRSQYAT